MASNNITDYGAAYGGSPASQGPQGQQGANQQLKPDSIYDPSRAALWKPAPASSSPTSQNSGNLAGQFRQENGGSAPAASGSPVTANGQIAPAQPQGQNIAGGQPSGNSSGSAQPTPPPASQQTPSGQQPNQISAPPLQASNPQPGPDPFAAMGGGFWTGQQWVPKNHPLAQQGQPGQLPGAQPSPAPYSPYGPYPGRPQGTTYDPGTLTNPNLQSYQGTNFQGYGGVDQSGLQNQQTQLMSQLLSNPALSDSVVNQMKAKQRESAMAMGGQQQAMAAQNAASRGTNLDSQYSNTQNQIGDSMRGDILNSYRDIDINAALQNRAGQMSALGMSNDVLNGQVGRQGQQYSSYLQGQGAMQGENQNRFDNQFKTAGFNRDTQAQQEALNKLGSDSRMDAYKTDLGAFFDNQSNQTQNKQIDTNADIARQGFGIDQQKVNNQNSQFGQTNQLNWASLLNDMQMGRYGLGIDYAKLQQQGQQQTMQQMGF